MLYILVVYLFSIQEFVSASPMRLVCPSPFPLPFGNQKFVSYICDSVLLLFFKGVWNLFIIPWHHKINSIQFSSVAQTCPTLCDPMNLSTPGLPVHHQLPELTQTHVNQVGDAIQPSHPLPSPSPPAPNPSQQQGLFQWVNSLHEVAKVLEFQLQHQSFQWTPRTDLLWDRLVGSLCSPRNSQGSSPTPWFKSINFLVLSFLHSPTLTSIHDHWKNDSLD